MNPALLRLIGILLMVSAAVVAVLNLKRVYGLGLTWLVPVLVVIGSVVVGSSVAMSRQRRN